jgi:GR25 family glycosyltransferase involved in LPS biosynthesis
MLRNRPKGKSVKDGRVDLTTTATTTSPQQQLQLQQLTPLMLADDDYNPSRHQDEQQHLHDNDEEQEILHGKDKLNTSTRMMFCCQNHGHNIIVLHKWWQQLQQQTGRKGRLLLCGLCIMIGLLCMFGNHIVYEVSHMEDHVPNPFTRAKIFNPIRYLQVRYWDRQSHPCYTNIRNYTIIGNNESSSSSYVINMDRDAQRMERFFQRNGRQSKQYIQRYSAYEWIVPSTTTATTTKQSSQDFLLRQQQQEQWKQKYPFVKLAVEQRRYGDAGCFMSHLLLIQEKLITQNTADTEYICIFEDDVAIQQQQQRQQELLTVLAPGEADIIFLSPQSATKRIVVPWKDCEYNYSAVRHQHGPKSKETTTDNHYTNDGESWRSYPPPGHSAVRAIGGFGAIGYIVTLKGAKKIIEIATQTKDPLDISFFSYPTLQVYLPLEQYDLVVHMGTYSTRRNINH